MALNDDQATAVRTITASGHSVDGVNALAGTGKTTMIAAVAAAYQRAGWRVLWRRTDGSRSQTTARHR